MVIKTYVCDICRSAAIFVKITNSWCRINELSDLFPSNVHACSVDCARIIEKEQREEKERIDKLVSDGKFVTDKEGYAIWRGPKKQG